MKKKEILLAQSSCVTLCQYLREAREGKPSQPLHWGVQTRSSGTTQTSSQGLLETMDSVGHFHLV